MTEISESPVVDPSAISERSHLPQAATALGVALVSVTVALSALYSRETSDLDVSNFAMGVLASVGLLGLAAGSRLLIPGAEERAALVSWPGAAGIIGLGVMLAVLVDDAPEAVYLASSVVLVLSVLGYLATRSAAFTLSTIAGLTVLYVQAFIDVFDADFEHVFNGGSDQTFKIVGAGIVVYVVVTTVIGWMLPATRVLTGIVIGGAGIAAFYYVFPLLMVSRYFNEFSSRGGLGPDSALVDDIWVVLGCCVMLALFWLGCAAATRHVGFRILTLAILLFSIPMATYALAVSRPTWWEVGTCAIGAAVLLGAAYRLRRPETPAASAQ